MASLGTAWSVNRHERCCLWRAWTRKWWAGGGVEWRQANREMADDSTRGSTSPQSRNEEPEESLGAQAISQITESGCIFAFVTL
jgi:hypothetical protein